MIGILVILLLSWTLLRFLAKTDLSVLGLVPTKSRVLHLSVGFLLAAITCIAYHLLTVAFVDNSWVLQTGMTLQRFAASLWWTLKSVLFEELMFRGALLYLAIKRFGIKTACLLSAACFGAFHIVSYNLFNNPVQMVIVFTVTGFAGYVFATAFAKTQSLYLPIGLHFGWNLVNIVVFSNGPLGQQLLLKTNSSRPDGWLSLIVFLFQVLSMPLLGLWYVRWLDRRPSIVKRSETLAKM